MSRPPGWRRGGLVKRWRLRGSRRGHSSVRYRVRRRSSSDSICQCATCAASADHRFRHGLNLSFPLPPHAKYAAMRYSTGSRVRIVRRRPTGHGRTGPRVRVNRASGLDHAPIGVRDPSGYGARAAGLDSLARVELAVALEQRLGVTVSDEAMAQVTTVADLERLVINGSGGEPASPPATWPFTSLASRARSLAQQAMLFPFLGRVCRPLKVLGQEHAVALDEPSAARGEPCQSPRRIRGAMGATDGSSAPDGRGGRHGLLLYVRLARSAGHSSSVHFQWLYRPHTA